MSFDVSSKNDVKDAYSVGHEGVIVEKPMDKSVNSLKFSSILSLKL